jgi:glutamate synthase (NADPH/NADH) large chain
MEPWDGPAAICFTDGRQIGATLTATGLRPARFLVTDNGLVVLASESGVLPIPEERIVQKWRLQPGKMLLIDLEQGRIVADEEIKRELSLAHPYREWLRRTQIVLEDLRPVQARESRTDVSLLDRQQAFGYTQEDLKLLMQPMAVTARRRSAPWDRHADLGALRQAEAPLHLLQAELRPGDEPADRPDPRGARDEPRVVHRAAAEHPRPRGTSGASASKCASRSSPTRTWRRSAASAISRTASTPRPRHHLPGRAGRRGMDGAVDRLCDRAEAAVTAATTSSSCPTAWSAPTGIAIRRCSPRRRCTTT